MSSSSSRLTGLLGALLLALSALTLAGPVTAAESPEAAVDELMGMVRSGDFSDIRMVVCESRVDAILARFDLGTSLDLPPAAATATSLAVEVDDPRIDLVNQGDLDATVRLRATLTTIIDEAQARELVRSLAEADGGQIRDEDLDILVPPMLDTLSEARQINEQVTLVIEQGEWLICGGLGVDSSEPDGLVPTISFDGICGLVPLATVNAASPPELRYDSSFGGEDYCSYSSASFEDDFSATLALGRGDSLDDYRAIFPGGTELVVAGVPAYAQVDELFIALDDGVLQILVEPGDTPPAGFDSSAYLAEIAELFAPLIPELEPGEDAGSGSTEFGQATERSLCEVVSVDQIADLSLLSFDDASGGADYCDYSSSDPDAGFPLVSISVNDVGLDELRSFFPDGEDLTIAGLPAYAQAEQLWVQLDGALGTFAIETLIEGSPGAEDLDTLELARQVAELAIPRIPLGDEAELP